MRVWTSGGLPCTKLCCVPHGNQHFHRDLNFFYFQYYATPPHVFLTVFHTAENDQNRHDAAIVWAENVNGKSYDACLRELKNFDGVHRHVKVVRHEYLQSVLSCITLGRFKIPRRRRPRKRHLKLEFVFFQSLSRLMQLIYFVKCKRTLFEPNS